MRSSSGRRSTDRLHRQPHGAVLRPVPNLYTLRGDKIRSAIAFIHSVDGSPPPHRRRFNGHDVSASDEIVATMTKVPTRRRPATAPSTV
jgi:hypothetical protein